MLLQVSDTRFCTNTWFVTVIPFRLRFGIKSSLLEKRRNRDYYRGMCESTPYDNFRCRRSSTSYTVANDWIVLLSARCHSISYNHETLIVPFILWTLIWHNYKRNGRQVDRWAYGSQIISSLDLSIDLPSETHYILWKPS